MNILRRSASSRAAEPTCKPRSRTASFLAVIAIFVVLLPTTAFGSGGEGGHADAMTFLWIALLLLCAKLSGLVERIGMPPVLGELMIGVLLGNLGLIGIHLLDGVAANPTLGFLAELGVVILLFQIGLESNLGEMKKVGVPAILVAIVGVVVPFVLGTYIVGPWFFPGLSMNAYLFLGAALTATSVGVTARVFKDLGKLKTREAQMVLGAAVIDDVLGLIILAVVSAIATVGAVSGSTVALITVKAIIFLFGAIVAGRLLAPVLGNILSHVATGLAMKLTLALSFCLLTAALAQMIGLAPIVGAFAAGLVLDPVHFRHFRDPQVIEDLRAVTSDEPVQLRRKVLDAVEPHAHRHVEDLIEPIGHFLIPLFFVLTGMRVRLDALFNLDVLPVALIVSVLAILGKLVSGLAATGGVGKMIIGLGMVPRGEVGLIFAATGASLGVVDDSLYAIIVAVVILTTLIPPPILAALIRRSDTESNERPVEARHAA
ncbi:MAG: cation:proton antiporter [Thermoanaerobaculia bacterium]|nr:cation:proton antiporter [Thermoanaerobaculia bacterium]